MTNKTKKKTEYMKGWRASNKEHYREYQREYKRRYRARMKTDMNESYEKLESDPK